jgi:hypothetical protein
MEFQGLELTFYLALALMLRSADFPSSNLD